MYNDSPINYYREDKLNIKRFSDSLAESIINLPKRSDSIVIGLMGGWGTGKSSILNLTETKLKGYLKVLRFNPWNYYSQQMLFSSFFDELIGCLDLNDKISALFQKYKYKIIGAGISLGSTAMPELRLLDNFVPDSEYKTLNDIKNKLDVLFKKQEKTVVIIDDIDRLNPTEVKQIFQLVKSLANFPNLIYILAFDKNYVNFALKDWNMDEKSYSHSEDFIDKIIQVPLTIPKFDDEALFNIFKSKFNKVLNNHNVDVSDFNIDKLYAMHVSHFFKNIRDINRYCNALDFYLYSVDTEIWIYDFALVTLLQIFAKDIYDEIKKNKDLLTGDSDAYNKDDDFFGPDAKLEGFLKNIFPDDYDLNEKNMMKHVLSDLFPKVNYVFNFSFTSSSQKDLKRKHCGIMEKEYFDLYFTFDNTNSLSKSRIDSVIQAANEDIKLLKDNLFAINNIGLLYSLINQLVYHWDSLKKVGIKNLIKAFIESSDDLFTVDEPSDFWNSKSSNAINFIYNLINERKLSSESLFEVINDCENNYFKTHLIWELDNSNLLNKDLMLKLKDDVSKFLSDYFEKTEFSKIEHIRSNIGFWKEFSSFEITNKYINNLNDENLISLISEYNEYNSFKEKDEMRYDYLSQVVDLNSIKKRFERIKKSDNGYDDEKMSVVDLFLDDYPNG